MAGPGGERPRTHRGTNTSRSQPKKGPARHTGRTGQQGRCCRIGPFTVGNHKPHLGGHAGTRALPAARCRHPRARRLGEVFARQLPRVSVKSRIRATTRRCVANRLLTDTCSGRHLTTLWPLSLGSLPEVSSRGSGSCSTTPARHTVVARPGLSAPCLATGPSLTEQGALGAVRRACVRPPGARAEGAALAAGPLLSPGAHPHWRVGGQDADARTPEMFRPGARRAVRAAAGPSRPPTGGRAPRRPGGVRPCLADRPCFVFSTHIRSSDRRGSNKSANSPGGSVAEERRCFTCHRTRPHKM
jgi:hypothetical protein